MRKAIFLDRDGTINVDVDYLHECDKLKFLEGAVEALALLKKKGYLLIVITNQSGVGRGYFPMKDVEKVNEHMNRLLKEQKAGIDGFYCCPHVEEDCCDCRKPQTGLYLQAVQEHDINLKESYMVGDKVTDILAAEKLHCGYALVLSGHEIDEKDLRQYQGHVFENLLAFAKTV